MTESTTESTTESGTTTLDDATGLDTDDLTEVLVKFGLGSVQKSTLASNGIENANYFLQVAPAAAGDNATRALPLQLVLTVLQQDSNTAGSTYVKLLQQSKAAGLPVPQLVLGTDGSAHQRFQGRDVLLSERLHGQHLVNPGLAQISSVGRFFGRWHTATESLAEQSQPFPRNAQWLTDVWNEVSEAVQFTERGVLTEAVAACTQSLARQDVAALPSGFIHGDCFRDNVLFDGQALSGVLDFHHAARGTWLFDLAVIANDWCNDAQGQLEQTKVLALLRAYQAIRPLREAEFWWFSTFCLYAATTFCLSRLQQQQRGQARLKDYAEFLPKIRQHLYHPMHLDPRLVQLPG